MVSTSSEVVSTIKANQGDADAQWSLGIMYQNEQGVTQDFNEAVKCFRQADDQRDADAQFSLDLRYKNGERVTQNSKEAVKWFNPKRQRSGLD